MALSQQRSTLEDFLRLPEQKPALEFFDGAVTQKVSPKSHHSRIQLNFAARLDRFASPRKLAAAFPEIRATFGGASVVVDIGVYRWERIPRQPEGTMAQDFFLPPDIAIEIASPGQSVAELADRCRWYIQHGVALSLLINPERRTVTRFRLDAQPEELSGGDRIELEPVLAGFQLKVQELFDSLRLDSRDQL